MIKPFTPEDVRKHKIFVLPQELLQSINELMSERYKPGGFNIKAEEIIERAKFIHSASSSNPFTTVGDDWYDKGYMDFESAYQEAGWKVKYNQPSYDENFSSYYRFEELK